MNEIDWNPLLCELAALRYELRAASLAVLYTAQRPGEERGKYLAKMEYEQDRADRVAKGGKA